MNPNYLAVLGLSLLCPSNSKADFPMVPTGERPNIILIMSDDMGYSDLGCYGSEIHTPNLDALAEAGLRYTQFYNQARCCPTRASLMTGLYPHQTGIGWMTAADHGLPGYRGELNKNCVTIAQVLKSAGYNTYMAGKWHLQKDRHTQQDSLKHNWPLQRGFDRFYGMLVGAGSYYDPATLCRDNTLITPFNDPEYKPESFYFTDAISDNALTFLKEDKGDKPFFLYISYTTAHWPMHAPEDKIAKYRGKYDKGWEFIRRQRFIKMKEEGVIDENSVLSPHDLPSWEDEPDKPAMARRMETYAAMIDVMDQGIGRLLGELKNKDELDNTIILFLQDNGGCAEGIGFGGPEGQTIPIANDTSGLRPLGGNEVQTAVIPPVTRDGKTIMAGKAVMAGPGDTYVACLKPWALVSNTPYRMFKKYVHEGGIATPLIIHWPAGIKCAGELREQVGNVIDIMPTLIELTGAEYPETFNEYPVKPMEGISLVPTFMNRPLENRAICWEHEMNRAIRMGKWKLVSAGNLSGGGYGKWRFYENGRWELYNMENDDSEVTDLSGHYPEIVKEMFTLWEKWAQRVQVFPSPWKEVDRPVRQKYVR